MESDILHEEVQQVQDEAKKKDLEFKNLLHDFEKTFSTESGKRIYRHLLERCHVFSTTFTGNSKTFFLEGERNIGLYLLAMREMATAEGLERLKKEVNE